MKTNKLSPEDRPADESMLSLSEVAVRLGVSLSFVHKLARNGEIESYRFGRCRRVSEKQLQKFLDDCLVEELEHVEHRQLKYF